jgi:hypothetical protein
MSDTDEIKKLRDQLSELSTAFVREQTLRINAEEESSRLQSRLAKINPVTRAFQKSDKVWQSTFAVSEREWTGVHDDVKTSMVLSWAYAVKDELDIQMAQSGNVPGRA